MSDIIRQLHRDHMNMARLLSLLDQQTAVLDSASTPDYALLEDVMHYMVHYADEYHHAKEDLLFERLVARNPASHDVIDRLKSEHAELARKGSRFLESIRTVSAGTIMPRDQFVTEGMDYVKALRAHMKTEEDHVFPLISITLASADWEDIEGRIQQREDPIFGETVQDRYHQLYDQIMRLTR